MSPSHSETNQSHTDINTMVSWPCTPDRKRFIKAAIAFRLLRNHQALPDTPDKLETFTDAGHYQAILQKHHFRQEALRIFSKAITHTTPVTTLHLICTMKFQGSTHNSISLAIVTKVPLAHSSPSQKIKTNYIFTKLSRAKDWMGMDAALPAITGPDVLVFKSFEPNTPAAALPYLQPPSS